MTNPTIELLNNHRSIRRFNTEPLDSATIETLVTSAQMASTSSFVQAYSIIGVTDMEKKRALRAIAQQSYVQYCGHLFVFVADFYRHSVLADGHCDISASLGDSEGLIVATVDAALAAQNLVIAAEALGLGACYIGSLRNDMQQVIDLLELPAHTYPLFGLVVGKPEQDGSQKQRLPFAEIYHDNAYQQDKTAILSRLQTYDTDINAYYAQRDSAARQDDWSTQMQRKFGKRERADVDAILKKQGFLQQ